MKRMYLSNFVTIRPFHQAIECYPYRIALCSMLLLSYLFPTGSPFKILADSEKRAVESRIRYDAYNIEIGVSKRMTVLTADLFDDGTEELITVHHDNYKNRILRSYAVDKASTLKLETELGRQVLFVDVANINQRDTLLSYEPGRLNLFDPLKKSEHLLADVHCSFKPPRNNETPHVDITRDLNGDQRDDLVVPDQDGFWIFTQTKTGTFRDPVKIGPPTEFEGIYGADGYRYDPWSQSRIHVIDTNQDGRNDLIFWNKEHFQVHLQGGDGSFTESHQTFTTDIDFDSDNIFTLAKGNMTGRALHSLVDMNSDSIPDLVLYAMDGKRLSNKQSSYSVYFGQTNTDTGIQFDSHADWIFTSNDNIQLQMIHQDLDNDRQPELMFQTIKRDSVIPSLWKSLKGFMGDDIALAMEFHRFRSKQYPKSPDAIYKTGLDGPPSHREPGSIPLDIALRGATHERRRTQKIWPRAFNSTMLLGDLNGDGYSELILSSHPRSLNIHVGTRAPDFFSSPSKDLKMDMPNDAEYTWLVDMNRDGKKDILMHQPDKSRDLHGAPIHPPGTESQHVTILIMK